MNKYTLGVILGVLGAGLNPEAQANPVPEQAPLVFEYNLAGPAVIESEPIIVTGIIKTIFISAESVGQVSLEVSANGGGVYTKIINGVPLVDGFIPGNQLRWRANIGPDSRLKKIVMGYTDSSGVQRLYRNPDLVNYKDHREIYISGGSQEVFNYPLRLKLDKENIYFTAGDGQTPLYYYIETQNFASLPTRNDGFGVIANSPKAGEACLPAGRQSRTFWVKVPQIPQEGTRIYVYYNEIASSPEPALNEGGEACLPAGRQSRNNNFHYNNGYEVFPFFDDFNGIVLNEEKWEIIPGLKKEYSVKDGYLRLKDCLVLSRDFKIKQGILEFKAKAENNAGIQVLARAGVSAQTVFPYERIVYSSNYPGAEHTIAINNIAKLNVGKPIQSLTDYMYKATINAASILFERYSENQQEKQVEIKFFDAGNFDEGCIGLKSDAAPFNAGNVYFDWIRVRPYVEVEPEEIIPRADKPAAAILPEEGR